MISASSPRWQRAEGPLSPQSSSQKRGQSGRSRAAANRLRLVGIVLLMALNTLFAARPAHAQTQPEGLLGPKAQVVVDGINQMRVANGIAPLIVHPKLVQAAQMHVGDMVANANYSHTGSDGSNIRARVARTGFRSNAGVSENWVAVSDASQAVAWWMNSYVHRNNMLNPKWTHVGLAGRVDSHNNMHVFVAVFGSSGDGGAVQTVVAAPQPVTIAADMSVPAGGMNYTVQPGDTLTAVAQRFGADWRTVGAINGLGEHDLLQIGQVIRLPGSGDPAPGVGGPVDAATVEVTATTDYVVRSGDTLVGIGAKLNQDWQTIAALNGLGEQSVLRIGQVLKAPASGGAAAAAVSARTHTVQPGETVITIAARYGVGWKALLDLNGLGDGSLIQIGQILRLP